MLNLKSKQIMCLVVGIASILTIISTISYAYFSAMADMKSIDTSLNTGKKGVIFDDNDEGFSGELNFGESITKKFTIKNTGTVDAKVRMNWDNLVNTYLEGSLTYSLSYSMEENGTYIDLLFNKNVPRVPKPLSLTRLLEDNIIVPAGKTYYYSLKITLNNLSDIEQTSDLNAVFSTKFKVEDDTTPIKLTVQSFDEPAITDEGVFEMEDDYGTSYYFRGAVENNYVHFAGYYWRIIRVNGDGSLRIIYDGTRAHTNGDVSEDRFTTLYQQFNVSNNDAKYVGWMFGGVRGSASTSKEQAQLNETDSDIKTAVDEWYKTNIVDKGYGQYVSDTLFCNDRSTPGKDVTGWSSDTGLGFGTNFTAYGASSRVGVWNSATTPSAPQFKCPQKNDAFTVNDTSKGNGALTYPVGLITADELIAAGSGKYNTINNSYYLYRPGNWYWSLSSYYSSTGALVFGVNVYGSIRNAEVLAQGAVAPVINLSSEYTNTMVGNGTMENPYRAN